MEPGSFDERLDLGIERALAGLLADQLPSGRWSGETHAGPAYTAMVLITEARLGVLSKSDADEGARWLRHHQEEDGSFAPSATLPGTPNATALCWGALCAVGHGEDDPTVRAARTWLDAHGGLAELDLLTRVWLALAGELEPKGLGTSTLFPLLLPGFHRSLGRRFLFFVPLMATLLPAVVRGLRRGAPLRGGPLFGLERNAALRYLSDRQNPDGSFASLATTTCFGALALHALGVPRTDPRLHGAVRYLHHLKSYEGAGMYVMPYTAEVWNTAEAVRALLIEGGEEAHRAAARGVAYLVGQQCDDPEPEDWQNPAAGAPRTGAFPFEAGNELAPDCDTTAAVLAALRMAAAAGQGDALAAPRERAWRWLVAMQNPGGGWPAFTHGLPEKPPRPLFLDGTPELPGTVFGMAKLLLRPPAELSDPAWEDVTGRLLRALGEEGRRLDDPIVAEAILFLQRQQAPSGAWWGRWQVNYLGATSYVLLGLIAVGQDAREAWVQRAVAFLLEHQNEDGGWGESLESYRDPDQAGRGPSGVLQTATVLLALQAVRHQGDDVGVPDEALRLGIEHLLDRQDASGLWPIREPTGVMTPPFDFYCNPLYGRSVAFEALLIHRSLRRGTHA